MPRYKQPNNPHRLYRDKERAVLTGVCAGIADYFGFNVKALRLITVVACLTPFAVVTIPGYLIMSLLIPVKPQNLYQTEDHEIFWRKVSIAPADLFSELKLRFRDLELRLQRMEAYVTSKEFEIDRELRREN